MENIRKALYKHTFAKEAKTELRKFPEVRGIWSRLVGTHEEFFDILTFELNNDEAFQFIFSREGGLKEIKKGEIIYKRGKGSIRLTLFIDKDNNETVLDRVGLAM